MTQKKSASVPLLIFGTGTLGHAFARRCEVRRIPYRMVGRAEVDVTSAVEVDRCIGESKAWAVVNATGYVKVDAAEREAEHCKDINLRGAVNIASATARAEMQLATFSSDLVFDGTKATAYHEADEPNPLNEYGRSKRWSEVGVFSAHPGALQIRTSAFFGPWDKHNFPRSVVSRLRRGEIVHAASSVITPTYVPALVDCTLDLLLDESHGLWHVSGDVALSWFDFARHVAAECALDDSLIHETGSSQPDWIAPRPINSALTSVHGALLPPLSQSLGEFRLACLG